MSRVTELRVRADWGLIRFGYLPLLIAGLAATRFLPGALRAAPCAVCYLLMRWANHIDESVSSKPILQITDNGIIHEDGGEPKEYYWSEITGVVMHRRNNIPPWRTDGSTEIGPPFWLAISVRDPDFAPKEEEELFSESESYVARRRRVEDAGDVDTEGVRTITIWPRQVVGGLFSLMRFAKELQRCLIEVCGRGEIPCMVPAADGPKE